jgi:hypothetical protein
MDARWFFVRLRSHLLVGLAAGLAVILVAALMAGG